MKKYGNLNKTGVPRVNFQFYIIVVGNIKLFRYNMYTHIGESVCDNEVKRNGMQHTFGQMWEYKC